MIEYTENENIKLAKEMISAGLYDKACECLMMLENNAEAMYCLSTIIDKIQERQKRNLKYHDEFDLLLLSAYLGYDVAMKKVGDCYKKGGRFYPKDSKKAFDWYKKAYEHGNIEVIKELINCYENGIGTTQDFEKVVELKRKTTLD